MIRSENAIVTSLVSRQEIQARESAEVVEKNFSGSLPAFIAAFASQKNLSKEEIEEIQSLIDQYKAQDR